MDTTTDSTSLASREFWLQRRDGLREGALATAEALGGSHDPLPGGPGTARAALTPATRAHLTRITGGEPLLYWTAAAAAAALVLRRFGADGAVTLLAGAPLGHGHPVHLQPKPGATFREWLGSVRSAVAETLPHGAVDEVPLKDLREGDLALSIGVRPGTSAQQDGDEAVSLGIDAEEITVTSSLLPTARLRALASGVATVLEQGLADPDRRLADISGLDDATRHRVLVAFNETAELKSGTPYRELLLAQAESRPDEIAVHDGDESFTYRRLCSDATAVALRLRSAGVTRESQVALVAPRSAWFLVMAVGVLFAGGAYVPVDPEMPAERRDRLLSGARVVVAGDEVEVPQNPDATRLSPENLREEAESAAGTYAPETIRKLLGPPAAPADLAYVIFTSGSTGTPKGAGVEHHSFLNLLATRVPDYGLRPGVEVPQTAPLTFDLSIWQMFAGLTAGSTICVVPDDVVRDPAALASMAVGHRFGCLALVPTFIAVLLSHFEDEPGSAAAVRATLPRMIATGEPLSGELARRWHTVMSGVELLNAYGPAEVADDSTGGPVTAHEGMYTSIGKVLPNVRVHVLDTDLQPLPPGVVGQVHIGGESVGRGYIGQPALTAAAFVPDPFAPEPGRRMYRTGDLGRWRADGSVELLGRADNQIKLRGRRVELGEIEHAVESHPEVARGVVELLKDDGLERLVAFVTTQPGGAPTVAAVKESVAGRLPAYMVPNEVLLLGELPRNRNGKVDRKALRALAAERSVDTIAYTAPRTPLEAVLCELWASCLRLERVGVTDDFFSLGGDSITGIRITQAAGRRGVELRPRHLLEHRTVEALARVARWRTAEAGRPAAVSPSSEADRGSAPLTPAQLAFFAREVPRPDYWNHGVLYAVRGSVTTEQAARAVRLLAERHPMLRARINVAGADSTQMIDEEAPPVTEFDLREVAASEVEGRIHDSATALHAALDLRTGPVCRAGLFRLADGLEDRLVMIVHHTVVDLYSWNVITEELSAILRDGDAGSLDPVGTSYTEWARRLGELVRERPERLNADYWLTRDWDACVPVADTEPQGVEGNTQEITFVFDRDWTRRFTDASTGAGLTVYEGLLAALGTGFKNWLGVDGGTLQVQLGGHGREDLFDDVDLSRTVGFFNTAYPFALPMLADPADAGQAQAVAGLIRDIPGRGLDHDLLRHLHPDPGTRARLAAVPVPQVLFNYWGEPAYLHADGAAGAGTGGTPGPLGDVRIDISGDDRPADMPRPFPIEIYPSIVDGRLTILWRFSGEVFTAPRMHALVDAYATALRTTVPVSESSDSKSSDSKEMAR
ncbi:amino acid adenylation domain-containing protein/non-ribosomal peptide synthase protein (TIGR01720 family) [Streptomyces canus]|uniref:amino acid adenylation domain-containing protein n=1 Tax=Streptomyces canus TaxID=58343 RepID=UPI0027872A6D|nr:amino acid adenylation domain-containing protein [Streptomyces canus]MDQ0600883.1 amino acid adenylation domain-containing protein/non-ribosomal peptide synthase protein (TIGR01720 family) [Streptomyces canus]